MASTFHPLIDFSLFCPRLTQYCVWLSLNVTFLRHQDTSRAKAVSSPWYIKPGNRLSWPISVQTCRRGLTSFPRLSWPLSHLSTQTNGLTSVIFLWLYMFITSTTTGFDQTWKPNYMEPAGSLVWLPGGQLCTIVVWFCTVWRGGDSSRVLKGASCWTVSEVRVAGEGSKYHVHIFLHDDVVATQGGPGRETGRRGNGVKSK